MLQLIIGVVALMLALVATAADKGILVLHCKGVVDSTEWKRGADKFENTKKPVEHQITIDFDRATVDLPVELKRGCFAKEKVYECRCSIKPADISCLSSGNTGSYWWTEFVDINRLSAKMRIQTSYSWINDPPISETIDGWLDCQKFEKQKF